MYRVAYNDAYMADKPSQGQAKERNRANLHSVAKWSHLLTNLERVKVDLAHGSGGWDAQS